MYSKYTQLCVYVYVEKRENGVRVDGSARNIVLANNGNLLS